MGGGMAPLPTPDKGSSSTGELKAGQPTPLLKLIPPLGTAELAKSKLVNRVRSQSFETSPKSKKNAKKFKTISNGSSMEH